MSTKKLISCLLGGTAVVALILTLTNRVGDRESREGQPRTYEDIIRSGTIRATTEYNPVGYHVEHDSISGFHYELLQAFARDKGLQADIMPEMELKNQLEGINNGRFDLIAGSLLITSEQDSTLLFSQPILRHRQVLVQRKPSAEDDSAYVKSPLGLAGKTVYVPEGSPARFRIRHLSMEIADTIHVYERDFLFSVEDDSVARDLMELQSTGRRVTLTYKEYRGTLPWRGNSKKIVTGYKVE